MASDVMVPEYFFCVVVQIILSGDLTSICWSYCHYASEESANSAGEGQPCNLDFKKYQIEKTTENKCTYECDPRPFARRKKS